MTSLIFGGIYLAHKGVTHAYRDKQRQKNYERWEGLRDEYDAQKKITRETKSLDIQRTGSADFGGDDRPIVSLRDLQEANDARTGWRPQESWEPSHHGQSQLLPQQPTVQQTPFDTSATSASTPSTYWANRGELRPQKTGATWDEGLPAPLQVSRRSYDGQDSSQYTVSRANSVRVDKEAQLRRDAACSNQSNSFQPQHDPDAPASIHPQLMQSLTGATVPHTAPRPYFTDAAKAPVASTYAIDPVFSHAPGGRMAELIERGY